MSKTQKVDQKVNVTLQVAKSFLDKFDAAVAVLYPKARPSRSHAIRIQMEAAIDEAAQKESVVQ